MIGYHYTTQENLRLILKGGLDPTPVEARHLKSFELMLPIIENGAIWVYKKLFTDEELLGQLLYVAVKHCCSKVCCLRIQYTKSVSAAELSSTIGNVTLTHDLGAGHCGHDKQPIDLIVASVRPNQITLVNQWDLLDATRRSKRWF